MLNHNRPKATKDITRAGLYAWIVNVQHEHTVRYRGRDILLTVDGPNKTAAVDGSPDGALWAAMGAASRLQLIRDIDYLIDILDEPAATPTAVNFGSLAPEVTRGFGG